MLLQEISYFITPQYTNVGW